MLQGFVVIDECCQPEGDGRNDWEGRCGPEGRLMLHWLVDPFTLGFMQRALVASLIVGVLLLGHGLLCRAAVHGFPR